MRMEGVILFVAAQAFSDRSEFRPRRGRGVRHSPRPIEVTAITRKEHREANVLRDRD
jgi:hypothetical protein